MNNQVSNQVTLDVLPHLPVEFMTAKQISTRVGLWSDKTIADTLRNLAGNGTAIRMREPTRNGLSRNLYRRA